MKLTFKRIDNGYRVTPDYRASNGMLIENASDGDLDIYGYRWYVGKNGFETLKEAKAFCQKIEDTHGQRFEYGDKVLEDRHGKEWRYAGHVQNYNVLSTMNPNPERDNPDDMDWLLTDEDLKKEIAQAAR